MPDTAAIREQLDRILASAGFQNSERLSRFLRFTVEAKLRGEEGQIKEYLIGREVFDRGDDYDARLDPIVRVEARRLRKRLEEYYAASAGETLRIAFPKGSYAPEFQSVEIAAAPVLRTGTWYGYALAAAAAAVILIAWSVWPAPSNDALLAVVPARWVWPANDFPSVTYDEELAELTATELVSRRSASVVAWPMLQKYRAGSRGPKEIATELHADRILIVAVRLEAGGFRVTGFMVDPKSGRKLGVYDGSGLPLQTTEQRRHASEELAKMR